MSTEGTSTAERGITTESVGVALVREDKRFQPRDHSGVTAGELERMVEAGRGGGARSGWDPALYDPVRVAVLDSVLYMFEGFHRLALARRCGVRVLEARVHRGFTVEEVGALA